MNKPESDFFFCPIDAVLSLIGGKYKPIILYNLLKGKRRYSELQRLVPRATPKVLTQQLRELERDGLISRTVYPEVPPRTEYAITEYGLTLQSILEDMHLWGRTYMANRIKPTEPQEEGMK